MKGGISGKVNLAPVLSEFLLQTLPFQADHLGTEGATSFFCGTGD
jgi:hypothetical protein